MLAAGTDRELWLTPLVKETAFDLQQARRLLRTARHVYLWSPLRRDSATDLVEISKATAAKIIARDPLPDMTFEDESLYVGCYRMEPAAYRH